MMHSAAVVTMFEGKMGGGKSFSASEYIAEHFAKGLTVCSNVELLWPGMPALVRDRHGVEMEDRQFVNLLGKSCAEFQKLTPSGQPGAPVLIVIDETHLDFNARDWAGTSRELLAYLTQARKMHNLVIFISQSIENIDKQFRRLMGEVWRFKDLEKATVPGLGITWATLYQILSFGMFDGRKILVCRYDCDGRTLLGREFRDKDVKVFAAYNSFSLLCDVERSGTVGKIQLSRSKERGGVALRVVMAVVGLSAIVALVWFKLFRDERRAEKVAETPRIMVAPQPTPPFRIEQKLPAVAAPAPRAERVAFVTVSERFVGWDGQTLRTLGASYKVGVPCVYGVPLEVTRDGARIVGGGGQLTLVGAGEFVAPSVVAKPVVPDEPKKKDEPREKPYSERYASLTGPERIRGGYPSPETLDRVAGLPALAKAETVPALTSSLEGVVRGKKVFRTGKTDVQALPE